jgi:hypothetical protein
LALAGFVGLAVGCGSGGGSGPTPAPTIRSFQVVRDSATRFHVDMDLFDAQADVFGGLCRLTADGFSGSIDIPIERLAPGANPSDPETDLTCAFILLPPARGVTFSLHLVVIDRAGNVSNTADFVLTGESLQGAPAPSGEGRLEGSGVGELRRPR